MPYLPRDLPPVLVADDNKDDQDLLVSLLERAAIPNPIFTFRDGQELMDFLRGVCEPDVRPALRPCLLFLDLNMPGLGGLEVVEAIRAIPELGSLTIVLLPHEMPDENACRTALRLAYQTVLKFPRPEVCRDLVHSAATHFARSASASPFTRN